MNLMLNPSLLFQQKKLSSYANMVWVSVETTTHPYLTSGVFPFEYINSVIKCEAERGELRNAEFLTSHGDTGVEVE